MIEINPVDVPDEPIAQLRLGGDRSDDFVDESNGPLLVEFDRTDLFAPASEPDRPPTSGAQVASPVGRGAPISHGAAVLASARNPKTALLFAKFLASPDGQGKVKEFNFMTSPILVGGSTDLIPQELVDLVEGRYLA
jgi:hypothetical protein